MRWKFRRPTAKQGDGRREVGGPS